MSEITKDLFRVCVKLYAREPYEVDDDAELFVPIFHDWIREGALDLVLFDVADYAHAPDSPGIMLVTHEISFALDRSDGRFGLLAQRRTRAEGNAVEVLTSTLRHTLTAAALLEGEPRVGDALTFDPSTVRIEANDRLLAPNSDEGYDTFEPIVRAALAAAFPERAVSLARVENDPRDRLAVEARIEAAASVQELVSA